MKTRQAKVPLILCVIAVLAAIIMFFIGRRNPYFNWGGLIAAGCAILFFMIGLTRFLRNRSITSGLFITTTVITVIYFVGNRFLDQIMPLAMAGISMASTEDAAVINAGNGFFTPLVLAQIGLFAVWFLLILLIIYIYVRPVKKIDLLLSQIIDAKEIKRLKVGKGKQYQNIAAKLQILADEKHAQEQRRQKQRERARALQARHRRNLG